MPEVEIRSSEEPAPTCNCDPAWSSIAVHHMASGQVLSKLRSLYAKTDSEIQIWNGLQVRQSVGSLATFRGTELARGHDGRAALVN